MRSLRPSVESPCTIEAADQPAGYDDAAVADAHYILEALHGPNAPLISRALAFERLSHGIPNDTMFWLRVYMSLVTAPSAPELAQLH